MKTILWAQSEDSLSKDIFIIDGRVSYESSTPEEVEAFHELTVASKELIFSTKKSKETFFLPTNCAVKDSTYYIQSCFVTRDSKGRPMPYRFLAKECESFEEAISRLTAYAAMINRRCEDEGLEDLKNMWKLHVGKKRSATKRKLKSKKKINEVKPKTIGVVLLLIIVILILIWMSLK